MPLLPQDTTGAAGLAPLPPGASTAAVAAHDQQTAELARYKLGVHAGEDADGYRRRLPRRHQEGPLPAPPRVYGTAPGPARDVDPARTPPACCTRQTITAGPGVAPKPGSR